MKRNPLIIANFRVLLTLLLLGGIGMGAWGYRVLAQSGVGGQDTIIDPNNPDVASNGQRLEATYSNFPDFVPTRQSLLQFDLTGVDAPIENIPLELGLVENNLPPGSTVDLALYSVMDDAWSEAGVTYDSRPASGGLLQTIKVAAKTTGPLQFDAAAVSAYLEQERTGDGAASFLLRLDGGEGPLGFGGNLLFEDMEGSADGLNGNEPAIPVETADGWQYLPFLRK